MIRVRCPICERWMEAERPATMPDYPFCSSRCRLIDLGRWLGEAYRIPAPASEGEGPADHTDGDPTP